MLRNDSPSRKEEGLTPYVEVAQGPVVSPTIVTVGPLRFLTDILGGHKTGFYFDQSENRPLLSEFSRDRTILDVFSYTGGFGLYALFFGARSATFVDASGEALDMCRENLKLNNLKGVCLRRGRDGFEFLKNSTEAYDVIVLRTRLRSSSPGRERKKARKGTSTFTRRH